MTGEIRPAACVLRFKISTQDMISFVFCNLILPPLARFSLLDLYKTAPLKETRNKIIVRIPTHYVASSSRRLETKRVGSCDTHCHSNKSLTNERDYVYDEESGSIFKGPIPSRNDWDWDRAEEEARFDSSCEECCLQIFVLLCEKIISVGGNIVKQSCCLLSLRGSRSIVDNRDCDPAELVVPWYIRLPNQYFFRRFKFTKFWAGLAPSPSRILAPLTPTGWTWDDHQLFLPDSEYNPDQDNHNAASRAWIACTKMSANNLNFQSRT
jgi:hypothetical protein